ncbi:hypothetical protein Pelo_8711 [Pelomyxa schiedti]|nr:hypothetical protein Pelo_8711 [Pelomyxa schiedti]
MRPNTGTSRQSSFIVKRTQFNETNEFERRENWRKIEVRSQEIITICDGAVDNPSGTVDSVSKIKTAANTIQVLADNIAVNEGGSTKRRRKSMPQPLTEDPPQIVPHPPGDPPPAVSTVTVTLTPTPTTTATTTTSATSNFNYSNIATTTLTESQRNRHHHQHSTSLPPQSAIDAVVRGGNQADQRTADSPGTVPVDVPVIGSPNQTKSNQPQQS